MIDAFKTVGRAMMVTSVILVLGFGVLSFSAFAMNGNMAKLTSLVIAIALIADFLLLPPLLMKFEKINPIIKKSEEYNKREPALESK